jgi:CRISPR-associated RAMP protein (TIGR02581 family)
MFKQLFNEATVTLRIEPDGPILIKAGGGGADPTRPDMEFVRTIYQGRETIYLPGSSLKGVLRAHCERLARTVQSEAIAQHRSEKRLSCDPLHEKTSCGEQWIKARREKPPDTETIYKESCFVCRLFGNTALSSRLRVTDAYPNEDISTEERNGVAIDRMFGSVAVGPFNYEVATRGAFTCHLHLRNFTTAQLGLLALALRDLEAQRVNIGFAKSRGLGRVKATVIALVFRYPTCALGEKLTLLGGGLPNTAPDVLVGVGAFEPDKRYGLNSEDQVRLPDGINLITDDWDEPGLALKEDAQIKDIWRRCAKAWRKIVEQVTKKNEQ